MAIWCVRYLRQKCTMLTIECFAGDTRQSRHTVQPFSRISTNARIVARFIGPGGIARVCNGAFEAIRLERGEHYRWGQTSHTSEQ